MLELGAKSAAPAGANLILDGSDAAFVKDVIEASKTVPIIVDFWATWCGPCKTLGPAIEAAVTKAGGKVRLVKIDVDKNPGYAGQLRVQSIPTVYAFWQGQPVDGFQGALPPSQIDQFIAKVAALAGDGGLSEAIEAAEAMLEEGDIEGASETFAAILQEDPANAAAYGGLVRTAILGGDLDEAEAILNGAPSEIASAKEVDAARAQLALARASAEAGPLDDYQAAVDADPANHQARFDLANAMMAQGQAEEAVAQLLELFRRDREWNEGAARSKLFQIFDALKPNDPIVLNGRRKLSSMIFV